MLQRWFRKYFIPQEHNQYTPHLLRRGTILTLTYVAFLFFVGTYLQAQFITSRANFRAEILPSVLVDLANHDRISAGQYTLTVNPVLVAAAQLKANDMAAKGYFSHTSPEGITPWYWFSRAGYDFSYAGENLAMDFTDSTAVDEAWMNSPTHRANIVNDKFTEIGIAFANGYINGRQTTFVVQLFGRPTPVAAATPAPIASEASPSPPTQAQTPPVVLGTTESVAPSPIPVAAPDPTPAKEAPKEIASAQPEGADSEENDLFVAVADASLAAVPISTAQPVQYSSRWERFVSAPQRLMEFAYILIGILILAAMGAIIFTEVRRHHLRHIGYGVNTLMVMIILLGIAHQWLFTTPIV